MKLFFKENARNCNWRNIYFVRALIKVDSAEIIRLLTYVRVNFKILKN